jgi:hypothetical protein
VIAGVSGSLGAVIFGADGDFALPGVPKVRGP